jgi:type IV secretory pathway VirB2 component (pilin)
MTSTDSLTTTDRRVTGACAALVGTLSLVMVPLYFVYSGPPPAGNVLSRNLVTVAVFTLFVVFAAGLRRLWGGRAGLAGDIATSAGTAYAVVTLVAASLETGVALQYPDGSKDPTIDGPLANGMALLHGPIARSLVAAFLIALAVSLRRTAVLPRWVGTGSVVLAVVNLAFVPSLYFGMDPAHFYAANGWGSTASIGLVNMLWIGVVGISILGARGIEPAGSEDAGLVETRRHAHQGR